MPARLKSWNCIPKFQCNFQADTQISLRSFSFRCKQWNIIWFIKTRNNLFQRDKSWRVSSTNTGSAVFNWFIRDGEFSQVMSNHFCFDLHLIKSFAIVNPHDRSNHLWGDNHIPEMRSDSFRLFSLWTRPLGLSQLLDKSHWLAFETTCEPPSCATMNELCEFSTGHV